jgi:hypothetical protein
MKINNNDIIDSKIPILKVGGEKKDCIFLNQLSQNVECFLPLYGEDLVNHYYDLNNFFVNQPIFNPLYKQRYGILDPIDITFEKIENHAEVHQNKDFDGTVKKLMNYLEKMKSHPIYPIDFNKPDWEQYFRYMDHIKKHGDYSKFGKLRTVGIHGLLNRDEAWLMYLKSIGYDRFYPRYKERINKKHIPDNSLDKPIPMPVIVHEMLRYEYVDKKEFDRYYKTLKKKGILRRDLNRYIQYLFFIGFFIGIAPEKEWVILNLDDIIDNGEKYSIRVTRPKVGNKKRILPLEKIISKSPVHKSMLNYLSKLRPKFADKNEKALLIDPRTGQRWKIDDLRRVLTRYGKRVYPQFYPYLMRHWCGTARMIEWDKKGGAFDHVNYWMGHSDPKDTKIYCQLARLWEDDNGSWLSRALKRNWFGGLDDSKDNAQLSQYRGPVVQNNSNKKIIHPQARCIF